MELLSSECLKVTRGMWNTNYKEEQKLNKYNKEETSEISSISNRMTLNQNEIGKS
jgi:hypothetical protein